MLIYCRQYDYKKSYSISEGLFFDGDVRSNGRFFFLGLKAQNPAEEAILDLVATAFKHLGLDELPVLAVPVEKVDQLEVFL